MLRLVDTPREPELDAALRRTPPGTALVWRPEAPSCDDWHVVEYEPEPVRLDEARP